MKFLDCGTQNLGLYPLVDRASKLELLFSLGITTAQLRIKDLDLVSIELEIIEAIKISKKYHARLFINDFWKLAIKHKAYGIHLGQEDLIEADLTAIYQANIRLGVSTHTTREIDMALKIEPSYLAIGPIFPTSSKQVNYDVVGTKELREWSKNVAYPIVAIGGITLKNIESVLAIKSVNGVAMISEFLEQEEVSLKKSKKLLSIYNFSQ